MHSLLLAFISMSAALCAACSTEQAYGAGQAWQRNACNKLSDASERSRCMAGTSDSYERYARERQAAEVSK